MNGNVTISIRGILATGVVLIGLVTAYLLGDAGGGGEARAADEPVAASAPATDRTLTMVGKGQATAVPDQLVFAVAVGATRPDLETALDSASRTMDRVLAALGPYGVRKSDVQSTGLSMYPVYDYHPYSPPTLRGYRVSQRASVLVDDLKMGGRAVSAAVSAGGNAVRVNDIRLRVGDPEAVMEQARDAAVAEATAKATQYAEATGQELGEVLTLRELNTSNRSANEMRLNGLNGLMDAARVPTAMPIRAGKQDLGVTVQVVWEFAQG